MRPMPPAPSQTEIHRGDTHDNTPSKYANHLVATPLIPAPARRHVHPAESPLPTWRTRISPNGTCAEAVDTPSRERWVGPATLRKIILEVKNRVPVHSPILTGTSTPDAGEPSGPRVPPGAAYVSPPGHYQVDLGEYVPVGVGVELLDTKFAWGTHALGLAIEQVCDAQYSSPVGHLDPIYELLSLSATSPVLVAYPPPPPNVLHRSDCIRSMLAGSLFRPKTGSPLSPPVPSEEVRWGPSSPTLRRPLPADMRGRISSWFTWPCWSKPWMYCPSFKTRCTGTTGV